MKVLVVDDHPLIREALRQLLKALDDDIVLLEAPDGDEAMAIADAHRDLGLVLLDLALPGTGGFQLLQQLREAYPAVPIVVVSAADQPEDVTRALDGGAMGFIPKTATGQILLNALRLVLSGGVYLPPQVLRGGSGASATAVSPSLAGRELRHPRDIGLTARQAEVLSLLIQGKPNKLICRELDLAEGTVKIHITAILKALKVANRTQAVIAVGRLGLRLTGITAPRGRPG